MICKNPSKVRSMVLFFYSVGSKNGDRDERSWNRTKVLSRMKRLSTISSLHSRSNIQWHS